MVKAYSKFHKLSICDGLEALTTRNYNLSFPFHFHQTYNISLIYEGTFRTKVCGKNLYAQPGSIVITNPLEIHSNPCESNECVSFFTFYISPGFFNYSAKNKLLSFRDTIINDTVLFTALHQIAIRIEKGSSLKNLEQELTHTLNKLTSQYAFVAADHDNLVNHQSLFKDYLANGDFDKFSLDHTAKQFGINKYKFLRLFKSQTGLAPNNYFILKRIEKSKEMLLTGRDLLGIAIDLGFYDIAHFSKHFKKFTGISPSAYSLAMLSSKDSFETRG
jgi:AraC-like DNA-binding protein